MDWKMILPLVVGASLTAAIVTLAWQSLTKHFENKRNATYLAILLAVILERFAIEWSERIENQEQHEKSEGAAGIHNEGPLPELQPFPEAADWSTLAPDLMDRVLVLPNERLLANGAIASCWDVQSDYVPAECMRQCGNVGYMAWALSADLRTRYRVRAFDPKTTHKALGSV
jgi:hypothetical protein